jgi:hypothetical protein
MKSFRSSAERMALIVSYLAGRVACSIQRKQLGQVDIFVLKAHLQNAETRGVRKYASKSNHKRIEKVAKQ